MTTEEEARLSTRPPHPLITDDDALQAFRAAKRIISNLFTEVDNISVTWSDSNEFKSQDITVELDGRGTAFDCYSVFGRWTVCFRFQVWGPPEGEEENMIRLNYRAFPPKKRTA